jgi:hypothetical protein
MLEGIARPEPDNRMTPTKRGFNAQIEHLREKNKGLPKGWEAVFVNEGQTTQSTILPALYAGRRAAGGAAGGVMPALNQSIIKWRAAGNG